MNQISKNHLADLRATVAMPPMSGTALEPITAGDETEILAPDGQEQAIGERLAQARKAAKLSKSAVAKIIGRRGAQAVTDYETGTSKVALSTVREIAAATGADVTWLWLWLGRELAQQEQIGIGPDAALIALCAQHDALFAEANDEAKALPDGEAEDRRVNALVAQARRAIETITTMHATTVAGIAALARTTAVWADGLLIDNDTDPLLKMLFRDSLALSTAHVVPVNPDAELLALHDRFIALEANSRSLQQAFPDDGARAIAQEPITAEQNTILSSAWELTATTLEGHRARARMLLAWDSELKNGAIEGHGPDAEMAWMLVRDLVGEDHADALQSCDLDVYRQAAGAWQSGVTAGASTDTDLIAACAAFDALERQSLATFTGEDMTPDEEEKADAERERIQRAQEPYFEKIMALRATTSAGLRAKVRSLTVENPDLLGSGSGDRRQCLIASICKDVLGGVVPPIDPAPSNPDAGIIALCDQAEADQIELSRLHDDMDKLTLAEERVFDKQTLQPAFDKACTAYDRIVHAPLPLTAEGLRAAARVAILHGSDPRLVGPHKVDTSAIGSELAWKLVGHLAGLGVQPLSVPDSTNAPDAPTPPGDDADLAGELDGLTETWANRRGGKQ